MLLVEYCLNNVITGRQIVHSVYPLGHFVHNHWHLDTLQHLRVRGVRHVIVHATVIVVADVQQVERL